MLRKLILLIFYFMALPSDVSSKALEEKKKDIISLTSPSKNDLKAAELIRVIIKDLRRGHLSLLKIDQLEKLADSSKFFNSFTSFARTANLVKAKKTKPLSFIKTCHNSNFATYAEINNDLEIAFKDYCSLSTIYFIEKLKKLYLRNDLEEYLKLSFSTMLKKSNLKKLKFLLSKTKPLTKRDFILSSFSNFMLENEKSIPNSLIQSLSLNKETTLFLEKHRNKKAKRSTGKKMLRTLRKRIVQSLKDNKIESSLSQTKALFSFYKNNSENINQDYYRKSLISLGRDFSIYSKEEHFMPIFKEALKVSKNDDQISKTYFNMIHSNLRNNRYKKAMKTIQDYNLLAKFDHFNARLKYWISRTLTMNKKLKSGEHYLRRLTEGTPLTFYSIIAIKMLNQESEIKASNIIAMRAPSSFDFSSLESLTPFLTSDYKSELSRLRVWSELGLTKYTHRVVNKLRDLPLDFFYQRNDLTKSITQKEHNKYFLQHATSIFNHDKRFLQTFKLLHGLLNDQSIDIDILTIKKLFPFEYYENIKKVSGKMDPIIILSLIRQESAFNPQARSHVGARGLMQLMLPTARSYSRRVTRRQLNRPKTNISIGVKYLKKLLKRFDGNLIHSLASYNAGQTRVKRWIPKLLNNEDPLVNIESIPFEETRKYVKLIYRNIFFYHLLTKDVIPDQSISDSFIVSS